MKTTLQILITLVLCLALKSTMWGQVAGDFRSNQSGNWGTVTIWDTLGSDLTTWSVATRQPVSTANVTIISGHTVVLDVSAKTCKNLTVQSGATFYNNNVLTSPRYVRIYGSTLTVEGTMGGINDGLGISLYGATPQTLTVTGNGTINFSRVQQGATGQTIIFDANVGINYAGSAGAGSTALYPSTLGYDFTATINAGKTVTMGTNAYLSTHTSSATTAGNSNFTVNVYGNLTTTSGSAGAVINLNNSTGKTSALNVYSGGVVNASAIIRSNATNLGTVNISVASGGSINGLSGSTFDISTSSVTGSGSFNLNSGATINIYAASGLEPVAGPIRTTTRNFSTGANYTYVGTSAQVTGSDLPASVNNLTLNNSIDDVTLSGSTIVNGTLNFYSGNLILGANDLTLGGSVSSPAAGSCIVTNSTGIVKKNITSGSGTFPIGPSITTYNPVTITNNTGSAYDYTARVEVGENPATLDDNQSANRTWILTGTATGGSGVSLSFTWNTSEAGAGITVPANAVAYKYGGSSWVEVGGTTSAGTPNTTDVTGTTSLSSWTIGNPGGALPVELTSFTAAAGKYNAMLSWNVASEVNAYGYEILRRQVGKSDVANVGFVNARGAGDYTFDDVNVKSGSYIYELKQVDNDGTYKIYSSSQVTVGIASRELTLGSYPNPFNPTANIEFTLPENGFATLKVFNVIGQEVATLFNGNVEAGIYNKVTFNASQLSSGMYFSVLESNGQRLVKKIMLTK